MSRPTRPNRNLCVAVSGPTMSEALATLSAAGSKTDMVELRLDLIRNYDLERLLHARPCPAIATFRPTRQGGSYDGGEEQRLGELRRAAALGAEWIDVELDTAARLGPVHPSRRIVSHHDFLAVPSGIESLVDDLWRAHGDAVKLAAMVARPAEAAPLLAALSGARGPSIMLGMGAAGVASRVLCLRYPTCLLTYASLEPARGTAPGQLTLDEMQEVYRAREISSTTRALGYLVRAEERELIHAANAELARAGLDAVCVPLGTTDERAGLEAIGRLGLQGAIVPPGTEERLAGLVPLVGAAAVRRRANTLRVEDGRLVGDWVPDLAAQVRLLAGRN